MARLISISEAREQVLARVRPLASEEVDAEQALERYLAADLRATGDVPPFHCSAMDGYAVVAGAAGRELPVRGETRAGAPSTAVLGPDEAIRISTGAKVPAGATAVARQEDVETAGGSIRLLADLAPGENIRNAGEVMRRGTTIVSAGTRIGPAEIGAAIAAGAARLTVAARPQVTVLSTGDELREPGADLGEGEIHNSNTPMLAALAARAGALVARAPSLPDERSATEAGLRDALRCPHALVISGGVSVGPHDHVKPALRALGVQEVTWGVALQPGGPTWFGIRGEKLVFGLPGNPVSAAVTFALFVAPALAALQGAAQPLPPRLPARLAAPVTRKRSREQALRVRLAVELDGLGAIPNGPQPSHHITSLVGAGALAFIPPGEGLLSAGAEVAVEPLGRWEDLLP